MPWEDPKRGLADIVAALNKGRRFDTRFTSNTHAKLLRLVRAWLDSGPDLLKMKVRDDDFDLSEQWKAWRTDIAPAGPRAYISLSPTGENFRDVVAFYFVRLILNPQCERLGLCPKCQAWFVRKTARASIYCSRRCAGNAAKTAERVRLHAEMLLHAEKAIRNYRTRPMRFRDLSWKQWVVQAEPRLSKDWITRAVTRGELVAPQEESLHGER